MRAVLDASCLVEILRWSTGGRRTAEALRDQDAELHTPHLSTVEVASAFRSLMARGEMSPDRAAAALLNLGDFPAQRHGAEILLPRIWQLRSAVTAYDATFIALAEMLDATLWTGDRRLARSSGHRVAFEIVTES